MMSGKNGEDEAFVFIQQKSRIQNLQNLGNIRLIRLEFWFMSKLTKKVHCFLDFVAQLEFKAGSLQL